MRGGMKKEAVQNCGEDVHAVSQARKVFRIHRQDDGVVDSISPSENAIGTVSVGRCTEPIPGAHPMSGDVPVLPCQSGEWLHLEGCEK